jgi:urate oxidase
VAIVLGDNSYGKAETRLLRVTRHGDRHEIRELSVSVALSGDFDAVHLQGDNSAVLPTDSQKNTVYAFAADAPLGEIEDFALRLANHFVATSQPVRRATVHVDEQAWERIEISGAGHPHAFRRAGEERRQARAVAEVSAAWAAAGLDGLVVLKSAGSEFRGFARDRYTTLQETSDRILATAVTARWRFASLDVDWAASFAAVRAALLQAFAGHHSLSLQQTLYEMGRAVLEARPEVVEIRLSLPNRHHFDVDVARFGLADRHEVFQIADRPYGLIEGTVRREDAPAGPLLDW